MVVYSKILLSILESKDLSQWHKGLNETRGVLILIYVFKDKLSD